MIPFWKKTDKGGKKTPPKPAIPHTAQQSIPMQRMFEDGTCRVRANYYTRTIAYQDINYQLAQQEDKNAIFEEWCSFLNFFDSSIKFELSFVNMATDSSEFEKSIRIPFQKDGFDDVRAEYSLMLRQQLAKGNNGLTKTKFITFGVEGESMRQVKTRLDHVQNDLLNNFHRLGVQAKPLNGTERLKLMHDMFHMDGESKFRFEWNDLVKSGLSVKDAIAPTAFAFKNSRTFQMGGIYCAASFLSITASDISDQLLKDFLDMDSSQIVTMHIQSVDQNRAIKTVKRTITELDRSKIEEQKKAIRAGYDIDIIPSDLATYGRDAKALLKELQSQNERMFLVTFLVLNTGRTEQELENNVFQASSIAQKHNCNLCRLDYQQEQGLMSSLPLADNQIEIQRGLTTSSTAIFIPFTTQELYQSGKESLYYGLNALSNNLIMVDRKKLKNPNGLILGTPGSGKSFSAKREIANAFLVTDDDIIINDPEGEYSPLVNRLKGQVIKISPNSTQFINPMDINANYSEEDNPLSLKADFILSLCELVVGGKEGLLPVEKTVIDRCVHLIYRKYFADPCPENMPILEDLYNALLQQDEKEAHHVATALEIYVKGSLNLFNHRTNVNVNNRIVCATHHNAVFVGRDADGHPRYASCRGIYEKFRQDVAGSEKSFGFAHRGADKQLMVFEAPIDLLSFIELFPKNWQQHSYLALGGVSAKALQQFLSERPDMERVFLCLDSDKAGEDACKRLAALLPETMSVTRIQPCMKDWNDVLVHRTEIPNRNYFKSIVLKEPAKPETVKIIRMSDVELTPVDWLWKPYLPFGKLSVLQGNPGEGKTYFAMHLAAACTNGKLLPNMERMEPFNVIYQTAEDGLGDTVKPRLIEAGADLDRVLVIDDSDVQLTLSDERIEKAIIENNARLVIIDPIQAYLGADVDMNRANEVRPIFMRLGQVAQRTGCAILLIGHLNKAAGMQSLQRGLGSIDIAAAVRSVMFIGKLKHDPTMRILTHEKSSLAPPGASLAFSLGDESGFHWVGEYDITADEMLSGIEPQRETKTQQAKDLICTLLAGGKQVLSEDIDKAALERGIPGRTVRDAKRELGDALKSKIVEGRKKVFWME